MRIKPELRINFPPAAKCLIKPGNNARVYREHSNQWNCAYEVTKVSYKIISVTDGKKVKQFNITSVLPMHAKITRLDLQQDMEKLDSYYLASSLEHQYTTEIITQSDPRLNSKANKEAVRDGINGLLEKAPFKFVKHRKIPTNSNVLGGNQTSRNGKWTI